MTEHLIEMAGALVKVKDGEIDVLTEPQLHYCPLRHDLYGCKEESRETVERVLRAHIQELGMFTRERLLEIEKKPVSFGASEIIMDAMTEGILDAAVVVCEGAGTTIISRPNVLQAVSAHMTGLISTEPIMEIQEGLKRRGAILLDDRCTIDQVKGYLKAAANGFKKIAVTVTGRNPFEARHLRETGHALNAEPVIFSVHNIRINRDEAQILLENCDIVWACASKSIRDTICGKSKIQIGIAIPVFGITQIGKQLILNRALHFDDDLIIHRGKIPIIPIEKQPNPLI